MLSVNHSHHYFDLFSLWRNSFLVWFSFRESVTELKTSITKKQEQLDGTGANLKYFKRKGLDDAARFTQEIGKNESAIKNNLIKRIHEMKNKGCFKNYDAEKLADSAMDAIAQRIDYSKQAIEGKNAEHAEQIKNEVLDLAQEMNKIIENRSAGKVDAFIRSGVARMSATAPTTAPTAPATAPESPTSTDDSATTTPKKLYDATKTKTTFNNNTDAFFKAATVKDPTTLTPEEKTAMVKALQKSLGFTGKDLDGKMGPKTLEAMKKAEIIQGEEIAPAKVPAKSEAAAGTKKPKTKPGQDGKINENYGKTPDGKSDTVENFDKKAEGARVKVEQLEKEMEALKIKEAQIAPLKEKLGNLRNELKDLKEEMYFAERDGQQGVDPLTGSIQPNSPAGRIKDKIENVKNEIDEIEKQIQAIQDATPPSPEQAKQEQPQPASGQSPVIQVNVTKSEQGPRSQVTNGQPGIPLAPPESNPHLKQLLDSRPEKVPPSQLLNYKQKLQMAIDNHGTPENIKIQLMKMMQVVDGRLAQEKRVIRPQIFPHVDPMRSSAHHRTPGYQFSPPPPVI